MPINREIDANFTASLLITTRAKILSKLILITLLLTAVFSLSACGQSGDLYLPKATETAQAE